MPSLAANPNRTDCGCRVLVVENEPDYREVFADNLKAWGYTYYVAEGKGRDLLGDAIALAHRHRCHLALVDMRLLNHIVRDKSGLELIPQLKPTRTIVVSSYGDPETIVEALRLQGAYSFVAKDEGPDRLCEVLKQASAEFCPCDLDIEWYPGYGASAILQKIRLDDDTVPDDEPSTVVNRLYALRKGQPADAITHLELRPVTAHYRTTEEAAPLERSIVFVAHPRGADGHSRQDEILKIASSEQILKEIDSYQKYVQPYLQYDRTARIEDSANYLVLWDIGAIRYTNIATGDRRPLRQWYVKANARRVEAALRDLFAHTLSPWYRIPSARQTNFTYEYYVTHFSKLGPRIDSYSDMADTVDLPGFPYRLLNPVTWVRDHSTQCRFGSYWQAHTHGDLHSDNVFVDQHTAATYVIDYERSGPGYILRDFVELETDIRLRLTPFTLNDLELAYQLDVLLLESEISNESPVWREFDGGNERLRDEVHKAFDVICYLRRLARQYTQLENMDEYYWALLMETLISVVRNYSEWEDPSAARLAYARSLIAASLLADRLAHWGKAWPPKPIRNAGVATVHATLELPAYNLGAVRQLIQTALNDSELQALCHDYYQSVYECFTSGMDRAYQITLLLNHCFRHLLLESLLQHVKDINPEQYARFEPRLRAAN